MQRPSEEHLKESLLVSTHADSVSFIYPGFKRFAGQIELKPVYKIVTCLSRTKVQALSITHQGLLSTKRQIVPMKAAECVLSAFCCSDRPQPAVLTVNTVQR